MLLTALTISFIFLIDKIKKEQQNQNAFEKSILFQQQLTNKERILKLVAQKILADPNTSNILKLGVYNRNLLNANLPHFQAIMAEHNLNVFEVGDKQGKVHFRFHRPKDFGDDKSGQIIIQEALHGNFASALEKGHSGLALRVTLPLFDLGTILIGEVVNEAFLKGLSSDNVHLAIYLNNEFLIGGDEIINRYLNTPTKNKNLYSAGKWEIFDYRNYYIVNIPYENKGLTILNLNFIVMIDETDLLNETNKVWIIFAFITSFIFLSVFFISYLFSKDIVNTMDSLSLAITNILDHRKPENVDVSRNDELGKIGRAFLNMKKEIMDYQNNIENIAEERTIQLYDAMTKIQISQQDLINRLGKAAELKDNDTGTHLIRISKYAAILAKAVNMNSEKVEMISKASIMHDVGKIGIPDAILLKPGKLTTEEFNIIKNHTIIGAALLSKSDSPLINLAEKIALSHHEKWDGSGYPHQLKYENIPLEARIVAIADVFDALISERPYKKAWSIEKAINFLMQEKGKHFEPKLVDLFVERLDAIIEILNKYNE